MVYGCICVCVCCMYMFCDNEVGVVYIYIYIYTFIQRMCIVYIFSGYECCVWLYICVVLFVWAVHLNLVYLFCIIAHMG